MIQYIVTYFVIISFMDHPINYCVYDGQGWDESGGGWGWYHLYNETAPGNDFCKPGLGWVKGPGVARRPVKNYVKMVWCGWRWIVGRFWTTPTDFGDTRGDAVSVNRIQFMNLKRGRCVEIESWDVWGGDVSRAPFLAVFGDQRIPENT